MGAATLPLDPGPTSGSDPAQCLPLVGPPVGGLPPSLPGSSEWPPEDKGWVGQSCQQGRGGAWRGTDASGGRLCKGVPSNSPPPVSPASAPPPACSREEAEEGPGSGLLWPWGGSGQSSLQRGAPPSPQGHPTGPSPPLLLPPPPRAWAPLPAGGRGGGGRGRGGGRTHPSLLSSHLLPALQPAASRVPPLQPPPGGEFALGLGVIALQVRGRRKAGVKPSPHPPSAAQPASRHQQAPSLPPPVTPLTSLAARSRHRCPRETVSTVPSCPGSSEISSNGICVGRGSMPPFSEKALSSQRGLVEGPRATFPPGGS